MDKLKQIIDGWGNMINTPDHIKQLSESRANICAGCVFNVCNVCSKCGCYLPAKTKCESCKCPIFSW